MNAAVLGEAPLLFLAFYLWLIGIRSGWHMSDFDAMRSAGISVLHGRSPYPPADPSVLIREHQLVYPIVIAYLFVPFALLPYGVAAPLFCFLLLCAIAGTLFVLGVRDWRCYGVVVLWYPTLAALLPGALTAFLALLLAVVWRYRDRPLLAPAALAVAIVAKLFLWPLWLWLVATRRWRAAFLAACLAIAGAVLPFWALGWGVLRGYIDVLRALDALFGPQSFSVLTVFRRFGAPPTAREVVALALGLLLVAWAGYYGAVRGRDAATFTITLLAALLLSPIVWMHYYLLLLVPLAIARRNLAPLWFAPLLYWASPAEESVAEGRRLLVGIGVTIAIALLSLQPDCSHSGAKPALLLAATPDAGPERRNT